MANLINLGDKIKSLNKMQNIKSKNKFTWLSGTEGRMPETAGSTSNAGYLEACQSDQESKIVTPNTKQKANSIIRTVTCYDEDSSDNERVSDCSSVDYNVWRAYTHGMSETEISNAWNESEIDKNSIVINFNFNIFKQWIPSLICM